MPLLDQFGKPKLDYLYVRDEAIRKFTGGLGHRVILLTPSAVIRGIPVAQREEHQERIAGLDEEWETRNLQLDGLVALRVLRDKELEEQREANNSQMTVLRAILADQNKQIRMLREKIDSREARINYLNSQSWWQRLFERARN